MLLHALPAYLPQISPGTHLKLGHLWLSLQSHISDPYSKPNKLAMPGIKPVPLGQRILNPERQSLSQEH